jgi:hypothetical protein
MTISESSVTVQAQLDSYMQGVLTLMQSRNIPQESLYLFDYTASGRDNAHDATLSLDPYSPIACEKRLAKLSKRYR